MTIARALLIGMAGLAVVPRDAAAQLDPLLFLKQKAPNIIVVVDTANRMQRDQDGNYRDPHVYTRTGAPYERAIGTGDANTGTGGGYRRMYVNLHGAPGDGFTADRISTTGDRETGYATFDDRTGIGIARRSVTEAIDRNVGVARFGLVKMRQAANPVYDTNVAPVAVADAGQQAETDGANGTWKITWPVVGQSNGSIASTPSPATVLVKPDEPGANALVNQVLSRRTGTAGSLIPAGADRANVVDAPVDNMLDDARAEARRLIDADTQCRNTVVVLVVAGGEGQTTDEDPAAKAAQFLDVSQHHRVPIYVIAIVPPEADVAQLQAIAANSGGRYTAITKAMIDATEPGHPVPEFVKAINTAVQHGYASQADFDAAPSAGMPYGRTTEFQVTSPIIGTVDLTHARDIDGAALPNTDIANPSTNVRIPQRSNLLLTTAFTLPGFDGSLRAFRTYKPVEDNTKPVGYKFVQDGTRLWVACAPGTTATGRCASLPAAARNIFTVLPDGSMVPFTAANAATLQPFLNATNAAALIDAIRRQPLGAIVDSTPAIMDAPSLDPPPDAAYPAFADANADRRSIVWVGANDGMFHAIDARLGVEVWAYIPFNLMPKLHTLRSGQPVGDFRYFVDGSAKIADVKIDEAWRTYLVLGEGPGGSFYQAFDVTLDDMANSVAPESDDIGQVLDYFSNPGRVSVKWSFPRFSSFDPSIRLATQGATDAAWGDIAANAPEIEKTVGETWSDPSVGEIANNLGRWVVLTGSGFMKYSIQQQSNRGGVVAGTTFYVLDLRTGAVLDSISVGSDGLAETIDNCVAVNNCLRMKNALQADVVATGPLNSRYLTRAYVGDLDGRLWRFDLTQNTSAGPAIAANSPTKLHDAGATQPMFSSLASVTVGGAQQYLFQGTGSDLLPSNGVSHAYSLLVILDTGATGTKTAQIDLAKVDGAADDEKVTSFPAVAGDIVFFTTTSFFPSIDCGNTMTANVYAFTFVGGPAYDTNGDGTITTRAGADSTRVSSTAGARASAPLVADQHLGISVGGQVQMFGDPNDYNNGVGQVGVRILSWREVR